MVSTAFSQRKTEVTGALICAQAASPPSIAPRASRSALGSLSMVVMTVRNRVGCPGTSEGRAGSAGPDG